MHGKSIRILTNMTFWQSPLWMANTTSIYSPPQDRDQPGALNACQEAWSLFLRQRDFDVVLTMGDRTSLYYGLLCAILRRRSLQIMTEVFIDQAQPNNPFWLLKRSLYRAVSKRSLGILTNSQAEVTTMATRFNLHPSRLRFVPMHSNISSPTMVTENDGFILSAGRTLRDYNILIEIARHLAHPFVVICGPSDMPPVLLPPNVTIIRDCSYDTYLDYLKRCKLVVLPLKQTERSTGQVVLLEAMSYGKPVIATRAPGTTNIIEDGINGFLVDAGQTSAYIPIIENLYKAPLLCHAIGIQAVASVNAKHSIERHTQTKLEAIMDLWQQEQEAKYARH